MAIKEIISRAVFCASAFSFQSHKKWTKHDLQNKKVENAAEDLSASESAGNCDRRKASDEPRTSGDADYQNAIKKSQNCIEHYLSTRGLPGLTIGVSVNGKCKWSRGFGYANLELRTPCSASSVMRIGSINKPIMMAILAQLFEKGEVDLQASIQKYVPSFPKKQFEGEDVEITLSYLVSNRAGIRHYDAKDNVWQSLKPTAPKENSDTSEKENVKKKKVLFKNATESLEMFKDDPLVCKPGTQFHYSTHGWSLVAAAVENITGKSFERSLRKFFRESGMSSTFVDRRQPVMRDRVAHYWRDSNHIISNVIVGDAHWPGVVLCSTVEDLLVFANLMLHSYSERTQNSARTLETRLRRETVQMIWSPIVQTSENHLAEFYGMGWRVEPRASTVPLRNSEEVRNNNNQANPTCKFAYHTGAGAGSSSVLLVKPSAGVDEVCEDEGPKGICVAILINVDKCMGLEYLALEVANYFENV